MMKSKKNDEMKSFLFTLTNNSISRDITLKKTVGIYRSITIACPVPLICEN